VATTLGYLIARGITRISFNLCEEMRPHGDHHILEQFSLTPVDQVAILCRVFDLWLDTGESEVVVRDAEEVLTSAFGKLITSCRYGANCDAFITIDYNGDVFGCECFLAQGDALIGNIAHAPLAEILDGPQHTAFARKYYRLFEECSNCEYYSICQGGCAYERWFWEHQFGDRTAHCHIRRRYFDHVLARLAEVRQRLHDRSGSTLAVRGLRESDTDQSSD
jgi:uncharacterized protein